MKKLVTLFFAAALVTAASAQSGNHYRNDSRNDNSYQSSPYSNNDQYSYQDQYPNNDQRYENEMMMRRKQTLYNQRMYHSYPYGVSRKPSLQISIGIGGHRY